MCHMPLTPALVKGQLYIWFSFSSEELEALRGVRGPVVARGRSRTWARVDLTPGLPAPNCPASPGALSRITQITEAPAVRLEDAHRRNPVSAAFVLETLCQAI